MNEMGIKYEKDILSLPASCTYELIKKYKIHACPNEGRPYSSYRPTKYITFRKPQGIMEYLYTIQSIVTLFPRVDESDLDQQLESLRLSWDAKGRLRGYILERLSLNKKDMAFTLHEDNRKKLYKFYILAKEPIPLTRSQLSLNTQSPKYYSVSELLGADIEPDQTGDTDDTRALEGRLEEAKYLRRSRSRDMVEQRKKIDDNTCQACRFRFEIQNKHIIECHHVYPLALLTSEAVTRIEDLVCLCPNCHRIAHSRKDPYNVEEIKLLVGITNR
jgi:hypothetical protein